MKEGYKDEIHIHTRIHLGWKDRLRVLFRGEVNLHTATLAEHAPGRLETTSSANVPPFWIRKPPNGAGMAEFVVEDAKGRRELIRA